jgi:Rho-binding antiterminator
MSNQQNSNRQYKPISGDFYDELEAAATQGRNCEITYQDQDGSEQKIISPIKDLFTEGGIEYARLENRIIPLNNITSLNGKTVGGGPLHTEQDSRPSGQVYVSPADGRPAHEGQAIPNTDIKPDTHDNTFKGNIGDIGKTGISSIDNGLINPLEHGSAISDASLQSVSVENTSRLHQSEIIQENLLGINDAPAATDTHHALIIETPDQPHTRPAGEADMQQTGTVHHPGTDDFVHGFTTSSSPFIAGENDMYQLIAHRMRNRIDLVVKQGWYSLRENQELGRDVARIAPLMAEGFTILIDLSALTPDADGTLMSPAIANKNILFNAGLAKVAELVPYNCDTLVHGPDSISVNSVRLRYFKDRLQAENWLDDDPVQVGTPDDMDLN